MLDDGLLANSGAGAGRKEFISKKERVLAPVWMRSQLHALFLLVVLAGIFYSALSNIRKVVGGLMFAMDDAWIHVTMARNLAEGLGFGIAPNHFLSLSTSPTWTLLVAIGYLLHPDPIKTTLVISFVCTGAATVVLYDLIKRLTDSPLIAIVGGLLFMSNTLTIWGMWSVMEIPLALLGLLTALDLYYAYDSDSRARRFVVPIALAFAAVTRPELFLLIPLALLDTFYSNWRSQTAGAKKIAIRTAIVQAAIVFVSLLPYFILNLTSHGRIFPTTYYAKTLIRGVGLSAALNSGDWGLIYQSLFVNPRREIVELAQILLRFNSLVFVLMSLGILAFSRRFSTQGSARGWLLPLALAVCPYVMGMSTPVWEFSNYSNRYFAVFPPLTIIMACVALSVMYRVGGLKHLTAICAVLMLLYPVATIGGAMQRLAFGADSTNQLYVESSKWLKDNLPADAVVAVNDIGTYSYFLKREMIDVMGLATTEIWPAIYRPAGKRQDLNKMRDFLRERKVDYVILCPLYYPAITNDKAVFEPIKQWSERYDHNRLISPQVLYKVHWDREKRTT